MLESSVSERYVVVRPKERWCQGDIFRDLTYERINVDRSVERFKVPYLILVNQDYDLQQYQSGPENDSTGKEFNNYIPNALMIPGYPADVAREGKHLIDLYGYAQRRIDSKSWKVVCQNQTPRYHFFPGVSKMQVPDILCDFKHTVTIPFEIFIEQAVETYLATINVLFREDLSSRFSSYIARIGLPVLK